MHLGAPKIHFEDLHNLYCPEEAGILCTACTEDKTMKAATVRLNVLSDSIGSEWSDIDAAGEAYASLLESRLQQSAGEAGFATDDISVTYHHSLAGYSNDSVWADQLEAEEQLQDIVRNTRESAWIEFCESNSEL